MERFKGSGARKSEPRSSATHPKGVVRISFKSFKEEVSSFWAPFERGWGRGHFGEEILKKGQRPESVCVCVGGGKETSLAYFLQSESQEIKRPFA